MWMERKCDSLSMALVFSHNCFLYLYIYLCSSFNSNKSPLVFIYLHLAMLKLSIEIVQKEVHLKLISASYLGNRIIDLTIKTGKNITSN